MKHSPTEPPRTPPISPLQVMLACVIVAAVLAGFSWLGPEPGAAADAALARAVERQWRQPATPTESGQRGGLHGGRGAVLDQNGICPRTVAAAKAHVAPQSGQPSLRCVLGNGQLRLELRSDLQPELQPELQLKPPSTKLPSVRVPTALSLVGPLAAVALVLTLRNAALGLFLAVILGAMAVFGPISGLQVAVVDVFVPTLTDTDNLLILAFTATMLGMVHVAMAGGGFADLAWRIARNAHGHAARRRTRMAAWLLGLAIFFDDYANSLVVGSSIRPLADRTGVSRAKLAYLVDATSAAVAGIAIVSTWVGFEVGLLDDQIARFSTVADAGYGVFLAALPFRFYCLLTVVFAGLIAWTGRDYGPMFAAESRVKAAHTSNQKPPGRAHWLDAMGPVLAVLFTVVGLDLWFGRMADGGLLARFIAGADKAGLQVLAAAGIVGSAAAVAGSVARRLLSTRAALGAWFSGVKAMLPILAILVCAMSMRVVCDRAGTPNYLAAMLSDVSGAWLPLISFFIAALVAFMTGSSWATMGILLPIVVPLAAEDPGVAAVWLLGATAAVLDGAIFGDHCSPISDTTVMSSAASGCRHDEHVWTQLPYAATVMLAAATCGYIGTAWFGLSAPMALFLGVIVLTTVIRVFGRRQAEV